MTKKYFVLEFYVLNNDGFLNDGSKTHCKIFINQDRLAKFGKDFVRKALKNQDMICREASGILEFHIAGRTP